METLPAFWQLALVFFIGMSFGCIVGVLIGGLARTSAEAGETAALLELAAQRIRDEGLQL